MAIFVQCKTCLATCNVPDGEDPHEYFRCDCCTGDHHHGVEANACPGTHDGDCWQGPQSGPKPDGCTVCRPILFYSNAAAGPAGG